LRASELRGLRWVDVDLKRGEIHVRQRADRYNKIGRPKSKAGTRTVPIAPMLVSILREWKLACPHSALGLAFPNGAGSIESHQNIVQRGLQPAMIAAGLTKDGKAKYPGLYALRHFYASWCINRRADGGLELPLKVVPVRMGHSSISAHRRPLWPPIPARRRRHRAGRGRKGVPVEIMGAATIAPAESKPRARPQPRATPIQESQPPRRRPRSGPPASGRA
jgi:integrase